MKKPKDAICVDGSCNVSTGESSYRGVDLRTGEELFREDIGVATNNIAEYLAICHAVYYVRKNNLDLPIYSDSQTAIIWVNRHYVRTNCKNNNIKQRINRALLYMADKKPNLHKWITKKWGEIPADFGRK